MLIQFSIHTLNIGLTDSSLEDLSLEFIENFNRLGRYASRIDIGDDVLIYGNQPLTGILFDYCNALSEIRKGRFREFIIDSNSVAKTCVGDKSVDLDFGENRDGTLKTFSIPLEQFEDRLVESIYRIAFGIYMIDLAEGSADRPTF